MASLTIRNLDKDLKSQLRIRAAKHGRSMEEEVRTIIKSALALEQPKKGSLAEVIHERFALFGRVEIPKIPREEIREPIDFS